MKNTIYKPVNLLLITIILYVLYVHIKIINHEVLLVDDLSKVYQGQNITSSFFSFLSHFLDSSTMSARPISGIVTGIVIYLSKFNINLYYIGFIFFPISLLFLYKVLSNLFDENFSVVATAIYASSIYATSIQFSPIMLNSNLALLFWLLSIYYLTTKYKPVISGVFFMLSILSYEIFFPILILNAFLVRSKRDKVVYFVTILLILILYRKLLQPYLFANSYQRDSINQIFNLGHIQKVGLFSIKMIFRDYAQTVIKGLYNIRFQSWVDLLFPIAVGLATFFVTKKKDLTYKKIFFNKNILYSLLLLLISLVIFIFSTYFPTVFGFDNRNLGAFRLFLSILFCSAILYLLQVLITNKILFKVILASIVSVLFFVNTSIMNAWIYASNFNNELFSKLKADLDKKQIHPKIVCIDYNVYQFQKSTNFFILREPTFFNAFEYQYLALKNGLDPKKIIIFNIERNNTKCDYVFVVKD